jgi:hypothetical protein
LHQQYLGFLLHLLHPLIQSLWHQLVLLIQWHLWHQQYPGFLLFL